ncbi:MAG TPA: hypothetical protein VFP35_01615 [Candidatus Saccharimonadales bacterium]|nr:hypothetical protein [Candidatus Saccharimonadales bacterium]
MSRDQALNGKKKHQDEFTKYYIITKPTKLSDIELSDLEDNDSWRARSHQMQARRWKKIRHQVI